MATDESGVMTIRITEQDRRLMLVLLVWYLGYLLGLMVAGGSRGR